jgi:hypothetical protein
MGSITRYSISTEPVGLNLQGAQKVIMTFETETALLAYDRSNFDNNAYISFAAGTIAVLDANPITGLVDVNGILWAKTASGTGTVTVWILREGGF